MTLIQHMLLNVYFKRERECAGKEQRDRGREKIPSRLHAVSTEPNLGLNLMRS